METNTDISKEILTRLVKLQSDVEDIKVHIKIGGTNDLDMEIKNWENVSVEDSSNFLEENNL